MNPEHLFRDTTIRPGRCKSTVLLSMLVFLVTISVCVCVGSMLFGDTLTDYDLTVLGDRASFIADPDSASTNVTFLGNSRIYRNIAPATFDQEARDIGIESESYNLGVDGLSFVEAHLLIELIEKTPSFRPKLLFMEPSLARGIKGSPLLKRNLYTHDFQRTVWALRYHLVDEFRLAGLLSTAPGSLLN